MCHSATYRYSKHLPCKYSCCRGCTSDKCCPCTIYSSIHIMCPARPEVRNKPACCCIAYPPCLGSNKRLVVYFKKYCCFYKLCINKWCNNSNNRLIRVHNRPLFKRINISPEFKAFKIF